MKKTLLALCAVAMLGMASCDREDNPVNPQPTPDPIDPPAGMTDGIYQPKMKIVKVLENGEMLEMWTWSDSLLASVKEYDEGRESGTMTFTYQGNRLTRMSGGEGREVTFAYSGDAMTSMTMQFDGASLQLNVSHSGNKVSQVAAEVPEALLAGLMGDDDDEMPDFLKNGGADMKIDLTWTGENVSRTVSTITLKRELSGSELQDMAGNLGIEQLQQLTSNYPMLGVLIANATFQLQVDIVATSTATYDSRKNPLKGYIGGLDPEDLFPLFSANNVVEQTMESTMSYSVSIPDELMTTASAFNVDLSAYGITNPMTGSIPMDEPETDRYDYQYNDNGFPTRVICSWGSKEYIYAE